jgi:hypothetical protein
MGAEDISAGAGVPAERVRRHDVIGHPGLGAAIAAGAVQPLRCLVPRDVEDERKATSFVPTWDSYVVGGQPCSRRGAWDSRCGRGAFGLRGEAVPEFAGH